MGNVKTSDRVQDTDIKRLNHVGVGLKSIADILGCHAATVTVRLKAMGIKATDTRRSFMEQVFLGLPLEVQEWLSHNLYNEGIPIKTFVTKLILEAYNATPAVQEPAPAPMPVMDGGEPAPIPVEQGTTEVFETSDTLVTVEPEHVPDFLETLPETLPETKSLFGT